MAREYAPKINGEIDEQYRYIEADEPGEKFKRAFMLSGFVSPANARLIAKAPELAGRPRMALEQIEDDLDPCHQQAFAHACAVLAQATGSAT